VTRALWRTDSRHTGWYRADPATYRSRVVQFFDEALHAGSLSPVHDR
jgi:hypothetical protein